MTSLNVLLLAVGALVAVGSSGLVGFWIGSHRRIVVEVEAECEHQWRTVSVLRYPPRGFSATGFLSSEEIMRLTLGTSVITQRCQRCDRVDTDTRAGLVDQAVLEAS